MAYLLETMKSPPVTVLLLSYNQASFVAESACSLFQLDYPNLQIILSDDCSTDESFNVLQAQVADYSGPHGVLLRHTPRNLGLTKHLFDAVAYARGELIVCAGGDDISYPQRVRSLVECWQATKADGFVSNWDVINEKGEIVRRGRPHGRSDLRFERYFPGQEVTQITGAASAYTAEVFRKIPSPSENVFAEDLYLTLMLHARGRLVTYVPEPLISYRTHGGSTTHLDRHSVRDEELFVERESARVVRVLQAFISANGRPTPVDGWPPVNVDWDEVRQDVEFNEFRARWTSAGVWERLCAIARFSAPEHRRWLLPRVFGVRVLEIIKKALHPRKWTLRRIGGLH